MPRKNNNIKRLNTKRSVGNKSGLTLILTFVVWLVFFLDMMFVTHNDPFIIFVVSGGIWTFGLILMRPGKFAMSVQQNGFWKTLFGNGTNEGQRRRRRQKYAKLSSQPIQYQVG